MSDKTGYGVAGILALGLIIATFIGGRSLENMKAADDGITVKGVAEKRITSDLASWRGQITLIDKDLSAGYDKLQEQFKTTIEFLKELRPAERGGLVGRNFQGLRVGDGVLGSLGTRRMVAEKGGRFRFLAG